jgi:hypothetical protein
MRPERDRASQASCQDDGGQDADDKDSPHSAQLALRTAMPMHYAGQTTTTSNTSVLLIRNIGRPQKVSSVAEPVF